MTKTLFARLARDAPDIALHDNGLPRNNGYGQSAEASWAAFAAHPEGRPIADGCHTALQSKRIWVWRDGCIETVLGAAEKGEKAIGTQETRLRGMTANDVAKKIPRLKECLDWIREHSAAEATNDA